MEGISSWVMDMEVLRHSPVCTLLLAGLSLLSTGQQSFTWVHLSGLALGELQQNQKCILS